MSRFAGKCPLRFGKQERTEMNAACCSREQQNGKVSSLVAIRWWCESHWDEAVKGIAAVAEGQQCRRQADGFNWDGEVCQWWWMRREGCGEDEEEVESW
jgi:hypothetical protein